MISLLGLFLFAIVAGTAAFVWLLAWCLNAVSAIPGHGDPFGALVAAWWLAIAWIRHWASALNRL